MLPTMVGVMLAVLAMGAFSRAMQQPYVVAYLVTGIALGPHGFSLVNDTVLVERLGELGVVLLLFFIGMEVHPEKLKRMWKVAFFGTGAQILISVGMVWGLGFILDWTLERIFLVGFVVSLSSTAVVLKTLEENGELNSRTGQDVLGILLMEDLAVIPMLIILGSLGGKALTQETIALQVVGAILMLSLVVWMILKKSLHLPFSQRIRTDHELQVFAALALCFGFAGLSALFGLSTALGAFIAGMLVATAKETQWIHHHLEPFRVVFLALFFVSVGMLVDLDFVFTHWWKLLMLVAVILIVKTLLNGAVLRWLGYSWRDGLYGGALLAQIGEFSFVLAAVGSQINLISEFGYQLAIAVIALSLLVAPIWIRASRTIFRGGVLDVK
jgi:CPA2 family monovalent cation:H+ antiporter-2